MFYIFSGRMTEMIHRLFRKAKNCFILRSLNRLIAAVLHLMPIIYDMTTMILPVIDQIYWRVSVCLMKRNAVHFNYQAHQAKRWFGLNSVWLRRYNQIYNLCCWNSLASKLKQSHFSHAFTSQQCRWLALWQHQWVEQSWNPLPNFLFICLFGSDNLNLWSFSI